MHPQQVVKLGKYHHERSTEEVCWGGEDGEESKNGEGEVSGWCCMCIFGVGGEDGDGKRVEAKVSDSEARR